MAKNSRKPLPRHGKPNNGTNQKKGKPQKQHSKDSWSPWATVLDPTPENAKKLLKHPCASVREAAKRYLDTLAKSKA